MQPLSTPPIPYSNGRQYTCNWCGSVSDGTSLSCPACGATVDVQSIVTPTGWTRAPGRKDMAKLQFGQSYCQIEGAYVPVADVSLAPNDGVYFAHHVLLWKELQTKVSAMSLKGAFKRALAGMPVIMTQAVGPGHIAFSRDAPGEMLAFPLQPGHSIDVREHILVFATHTVGYDWFKTNIWFNTKKEDKDETETHYPLGMFMDRFKTGQYPGLVVLHASGNVFIRELKQGQSILIKPTALLFKDSTVNMQLHFEHPNSFYSWRSSWSMRYLWLNLVGPGRVAVQSAYEPVEDDGRAITGSSPATRKQW